MVYNRSLVKHMEPYKTQVDRITKHIKSDYMNEMATKSKAVCLWYAVCVFYKFVLFHQGSTGCPT